jgi:hypothetical protein
MCYHVRMKKNRNIFKDREMFAVVFCLIAVTLLCSTIGYQIERRAAALVAWDQSGPAVQADESLSFDFLSGLRLGNPFWFLK